MFSRLIRAAIGILFASAVYFLGMGHGKAAAAAFDCLVEPALTVKVGSPVTGVLRSVEVTRGQRVAAGDVIARMEASVEEASVALSAARAENLAEIEARRVRVDHAAGELARTQRLVQGNFVSAQRVDELRALFLAAQQELAIAELNRRIAELELVRARALLEQRVIRAPIAGVVTERVLGPGEYVHQESHIAIIAATDPLHVEAFPPVRFFGAIRPGVIGTVHLDAPVGAAFPATVTVTDEVFDPGSGTFGVRLSLANPDRLPAGLRCRVSFEGIEAPAAGAAPGPRIGAR
jgi:RND family efflux transporter MFP subunit